MGKPLSPRQTWMLLNLPLGILLLLPTGCRSPPAPSVGGRDCTGVGQGQAGAALLTHSMVPK